MAVKFSATFKPNTQLRSQIEAAAFRGVVAGTNLVRNNILTLIRLGPKTGRMYRRRGRRVKKDKQGNKKGTGGWHQASAPGEAPAVDYGVYVKGITAKYDRVRLRGWVNSSGVQAKALEYGSARIKPRPHMRPGLNMSRPGIVSGIAQAIKTSLGSK